MKSQIEVTRMTVVTATNERLVFNYASDPIPLDNRDDLEEHRAIEALRFEFNFNLGCKYIFFNYNTKVEPKHLTK